MWHCRFGIHIYSIVRSNIVVIYVWLRQLNQILASLKWSPTGTDFEIYGVVVQEGKKQPFNVVDEELNEKTMLRTCLFFLKIDFFFLAYMSYIPIYKIKSKTQIESCLVDIISKRWEKHIHGWIKWPNILSCTHNSNCII